MVLANLSNFDPETLKVVKNCTALAWKDRQWNKELLENKSPEAGKAA